MSWSALTSREQKMFVRLFSAGVMGLLCAALYVLVREKLIVFLVKCRVIATFQVKIKEYLDSRFGPRYTRTGGGEV